MPIVEITLPKLGESVAEATITSWLKQVGDTIEKDETLCEIGTDKVESELPSEFSGVITELCFHEGETVSVGTVIAKMSSDDATVQPSSQSVRDSSEKPTASDSERGLVADSPTVTRNTGAQQQFSEGTGTPKFIEEVGFLTPVVRRMIAENSIGIEELNRLRGSGANGRITKKDIDRFLATKAKSLKPAPTIDLETEEGDTIEPLSRMRKVMAERMVEANQWIPHITTFAEIDVANLKRVREAAKQEFFELFGSKLTLTHLMMQAVVESLLSYPRLNAWMNGEDVYIKKNVNLAFAVAVSDDKLLVPNIKAAQNLNLPELVDAVNQLGERAKSGSILIDDLQNATFTVSNTGIFGSRMGTPIITAPQVAILAFGSILRKPVVKETNGEEQIVASDVMNVSLSYDHRVIDGKLASEFLIDLKQRIEQIKEIKF